MLGHKINKEPMFRTKGRKDRDKKRNAKKKGTWQNIGLDSNNHLLKELDKEVEKELKLLKSMVDDE